MFPWQCGQLPRAAWWAGKAWGLPQPHWAAGAVAPKPGLGARVLCQGHLAVLALTIALTMLQLCTASSAPSSLSQLCCSPGAGCCPASEQGRWLRLPPAKGGSTRPRFPPALPGYTHSSCFPSRAAHLQEPSISLCSSQSLQKTHLAR